MAFELHRHAFPGVAASAIQAGQIVGLATGAGDRGVCPVASSNEAPFGVALASAALGEAVTVHGPGNIVKVTAVASIGVGAPVAVSAAASGVTVRSVAVASGSVNFAVGDTVSAAGAGETLSIHVHPRQLGGNA